MLTVGVDLSAEANDTWIATIDWYGGRAHLVQLDRNASDADITTSAEQARKVGIDCPFGWPEKFYEFISQHRRGDVAPQQGLGKVWREQLAYRTTDLAIKQRWTDSHILSVSTDKLGRVALRCAALLAQMRADGTEVDRAGITGAVVEIYPAGSLRVWECRYRGYKKDKPALRALVDELARQAPWLDLREWYEACANSHDAFDAVIASLTARAAALQRATRPAPSQMAAAKIEGWIRLPDVGSLPHLAEAHETA